MSLRARRVEHEHGIHDAVARQRGHCLERAGVGAFGKDDAPSSGRRPNADTLQKAHPPARAANLASNARSTTGCTSPPMSPWNRATSRTMLALMYVVSSDGTMKTVSKRGER